MGMGIKKQITNNRKQEEGSRQIRGKKYSFSISLLSIICSLFFVSSVHATSIETVYRDRYTINDSQDVAAEREIELTNTTATVYVSDYEFSFGNPEVISHLTITEDTVPADFSTKTEAGKLLVSVHFRNPAVGKEAVKKLLISYELSNFVSDRGIYHEIYLPVSAHTSSEILKGYRIEVNTPATFPDVSIAKPKLSSHGNHTFVWDDVRGLEHKNVFLAFSDTAYYQVELTYALPNNAPFAQKTTIPFIPEGSYQKIFVTSIDPPPTETKMDADDNYLGVYTVPAQSVLHISFKATVVLSMNPRDEIRTHIQHQFNKTGLERYLTDEKYWNISDATLANSVTTPLKNQFDIYNFVSQTLSYDTSRINAQLTRMGATWVLQNPSHAVCMEYSDLFIALCREKGIPAREVVGYAVTDDFTRAPTSFFGDVLHAWPEYFDRAREIWQHVDPTWGSTAKVDYFSGFDLNHISLVYHGKDTTYPLPPGVYKVRENTKDVNVHPVDSIPSERRQLEVLVPSSIQFAVGSKNKMNLVLTSQSNVFLYNILLTIRDKDSQAVLGSMKIDLLEPYGSHQYSVELSPFNVGSSGGTLEILADQNVLTQRPYSVHSPLMLIVNQYKGVIIGIVGAVLVIIFGFIFFR